MCLILQEFFSLHNKYVFKLEGNKGVVGKISAD